MTRAMNRFRPEQLRELVLLVLIALLVLFFGTQIDNYFTARTLNRVTSSVAIIAVVAIGQTLVVLTRNIDLSVGSIVGFTAYFVGTQLARNNELTPFVVLLLACGVGAAMGGVNGLLVAYGRVPAIIVTLGTLAIYRTMLVEYSDAQSVLTSELPLWVQNFPQVNVFSRGELELRLIFMVAVVVVIIFQMLLSYARFGRRLYAIGSNPEAARLSGFPSQRIVLLAFLLCGGLAGLAGFLTLARFGNVTVVAGQGIELQSVAAVVVGGVSINGGIGTPLGALLGATLITVLEQSLIRWLDISEFWRDALLGALILLSVTIDLIIMNRLRAIWARAELQTIPASGASGSSPLAEAGD
jgi:rhamnose transport system permease protein